MSFLAAAVQVNKIAFHQYFNHNDLYHVAQMGGMYLFSIRARVFSRTVSFLARRSLWAPATLPTP